VLAGSWRIVAILLTVLFLSWILLTEFFGRPLIGFWYDAFEYAFLLMPMFVAYVVACCVSHGIVCARAASHPMPLAEDSQYSAPTLAAMCESVSQAHKQNWAVRDFYAWVAACLNTADPKKTWILQNGKTDWPAVWRGRAAHWMRLSVMPAMAIILSSDYQFWLGDLMSNGLDRLTRSSLFFTGGEVCPGNQSTACNKMWIESAGSTVELKADAPDEGRLRFFLSNWPRSGRTLTISSDTVRAEGRKVPIDVELSVRSTVAEIPFHVAVGVNWALWAKLEYRRWNGEPLQSATYQGYRGTQR
jgi:hypothetical protein